jgi:predicted transcriptional regulator
MPPTNTVVAIRVSAALREQVRTLAHEANETQSVILRQLIRLGLQHSASTSLELRKAVGRG